MTLASTLLCSSDLRFNCCWSSVTIVHHFLGVRTPESPLIYTQCAINCTMVLGRDSCRIARYLHFLHHRILWSFIVEEEQVADQLMKKEASNNQGVNCDKLLHVGCKFNGLHAPACKTISDSRQVTRMNTFIVSQTQWKATFFSIWPMNGHALFRSRNLTYSPLL